MIEKDVREQIGAALRTIPSLSGRTYPWNAGKVTPPAAVTDLPERGAFDEAYQRGADVITYTFMVVVGPPNDRSSADRFSDYVSGSGPESVKVAVDGFGYTACDVVTVQSWQAVVATFADVSYLAAEFTAEVLGKGAPR